MKTSTTLPIALVIASAAGFVRAAELSLESAPPVVVATVPVAGVTEVDPTLTEIQVKFSKAMQDGSWSWSTWGEENYPETTAEPHYLVDSRTCVLPVKLQPGKFYALWLNSQKFHGFQDRDGHPAVPYLLSFTTANQADSSAAGNAEIVARSIEKQVAEFPAGEDLTTPEGACVAWQRANAQKDAATVSRLSLVPISAAEQEAWMERESKRDPKGLATYLKALANSKVVLVQTWRDDLASVVTFLPFPEGKGRSPYSARAFGRVNGGWKNLGEDRWSTLAEAKANFETKKTRLWQQFQQLKGAGPSNAASNANWEQLLNEDQRAILAWTDRQFRSFFDQRTFAGWPEQERRDLEARCIDALQGPRSREYYAAINTLGALHATNGLPVLRALAYDRADKDCRDRWMAIRSLGMIADRADVPELIRLVYHGNINTRWWAQLSLVRITGKNFGKDWNAWAKWWIESGGRPEYDSTLIRWWDGQAEPEKLASSLEASDQKFLADIRAKQ